MNFAFSTSAREVMEQVVREPRMRAITTIPVFAPQTIGLIVAVFVVFTASSYLYLTGYLHPTVMIAINGAAIYGAFTPLHDATHRSVSANRHLNDLLGTISCLLLLPGITTRIYRYLHLVHHRYAGDKNKDPDEIFVVTPWFLVPFVIPFPDIVWSAWYIRHWSTRPPGERAEFVGSLAFYIGFHAFWLTSPYAMEFFMVWMLPQRVGAFLVVYFFARIQHPGGVTWERAPFQATVHIPTNAVTKAAMLGQTVHCLHHFLPTVPFYRYHKAWAAGRALFETQNIPVRTMLSPARNIVLPDEQVVDWMSLQVAAAEDVAPDIRSYVLRPAKDSGQGLPAFTAGAHIDIRTRSGLVRQYSLCGSPSEQDCYRVAIKREPDGRGGSKALHKELFQGARVDVGPPRNNFPLVPTAQNYTLIAGGIGVTPLLAMAHTLHAREQEFSFDLFVHARQQTPFGDSLEQLPFGSDISLHVGGGRNRDFSDLIGPWHEGRVLYVCGPSEFMAEVISCGRRLGWPDREMHSETFVARDIDQSENRPFEVELAKSGLTLQIGPDDYLIDVLNANDCGIPCSCTQGICGSCLTPVLSGPPEHRDAILSDEERAKNDQMCVCVGRAKGDRLVLDI